MRQGMHVALCFCLVSMSLFGSACGREDRQKASESNTLASTPTTFKPELYASVTHYMEVSKKKITEGKTLGGTIGFAGGFNSCYSSNVQIMEAGLPFLWRMA